MTIEKKENSVWPGFPKNDPSLTDTVYVPIRGGGMGCVKGSELEHNLEY